MIYAAFDPIPKPSPDEVEALSMAARLATLAVETRRLYSDLRHRSEFDLLTDIHNRFSLDKHLELLIDEARKNAGVFGLIYIDLNKFKHVNDVYGHSVGDFYLQQVSMRMKGQLRAGDLLARLGGDEFAVLVTAVHTREDVEEIAGRLEHCFDNPFAVEDALISGSASVGVALYPEGVSTRDSLVSAADSEMYAKKHGNTDVRR
jgi:diguanylate cyclase (GGDEF)-like protein